MESIVEVESLEDFLTFNSIENVYEEREGAPSWVKEFAKALNFEGMGLEESHESVQEVLKSPAIFLVDENGKLCSAIFNIKVDLENRVIRFRQTTPQEKRGSGYGKRLNREFIKRYGERYSGNLLFACEFYKEKGYSKEAFRRMGYKIFECGDRIVAVYNYGRGSETNFLIAVGRAGRKPSNPDRVVGQYYYPVDGFDKVVVREGFSRYPVLFLEEKKNLPFYKIDGDGRLAGYKEVVEVAFL